MQPAKRALDISNSVLGCIVIVLCLAAAMGCSSSKMLTPNYKHEILSAVGLKRDSLEISKVIDKRAAAPNQAGIAQIGIFNQKVPYLLSENVGEFVHHVLDSLISTANPNKLIAPITVIIDVFEVGEKTSLFSEKGFFKCSLRFFYPVTRDSLEQIVVETQQNTSGVDVTSSLEKLIYKGLVDCAQNFVKNIDKKQVLYLTQQGSSESARLEETFKNLSLEDSGMGKQFDPDPTLDPQAAPSLQGVVFSYYGGEKIKTGIRAGYMELQQRKNGNMHTGIIFSGTFYDVENKARNLKGTFVNFGADAAFRYDLGRGSSAPYLGLTLSLHFGTEKIDTGSSKKQKFIFGPTLEQVIGISINKKVFFQAGPSNSGTLVLKFYLRMSASRSGLA